MGKWSNRIPWLIGIAYWMLMIINGRFNQWDFHVYYGAASDWISGGVVYGKFYGLPSGFYKYSLTALIPFVVFTFLPYFWASTLYYFILLFLVINFIKKWCRWLCQPQSRWTVSMVFWLLLIYFADHLERELFLGNINFLLLVLLMWFWYKIQFSKWKWAGWILAFVCLVKPHFVIAIPLVVLFKNWNLLKQFTIALLVLFLLPILFCGPSDFVALNKAWFATMADHNAALHQSSNTLYGILFPFFSQWAANWSMLYVLIILVLVGVMVLFLWYVLDKVRNANKSILYFLIFALVPSLTHTDTEHFLFSLPLVLYILFSLEKEEKPNIIYFGLILALLPFLFNSPDLIGKKWSAKMDNGGLGWANLTLLVIFFTRVIQGALQNKAYIRLDSCEV